jgi:hypothetical protein
MIKDVPLTGIFVDDQEAALDSYISKLGLELIQDEPCAEGSRWITVSPRGSRARIVLKKAERGHEKAMVGRSDGAPILTLGTDDVRAAYEELRERGVRFLGSPTATRGAWSRFCWTKTAAPASCSRNLLKDSDSMRTVSIDDVAVVIPAKSSRAGRASATCPKGGTCTRRDTITSCRPRLLVPVLRKFFVV